MKSFSVKSNAKRFARKLATAFPDYSVAEPIASGDEWLPALAAPQEIVAAGVPNKIVNAACVNGAPHAPQATKAERRGSKREIIAALLLREEGCTTRDILDATGWPSVTVPGQAKSLGIKLRQVKQGRTTTYYGTRE